jgi:LysM domain
MRVRLAGLVLAILALGAAGLLADSRPPRHLHQVGDHWTAWNPPSPAPAGTESYTIVRGDTLWDLAKRFYGNPYLWPQLWEKNQYILDAHWIYPGDPLVTGLQVAPVQNLAEAGTGEQPAGAPAPEAPAAGAPAPAGGIPGVETAAKAAGAPGALGAESDIYCSGYIADDSEQFPYAIVGSEYDNLTPRLNPDYGALVGRYGRTTAKFDLSTGDIVYLSGGTLQGLSPGTLFTVIGETLPVFHPLTGQRFGTFYPYRGRLRVLSVQETTAIAEIVHACDAIKLGDRLRPFEPEPVPLGRSSVMRPPNLPVPAAKLQEAPTILYSRGIISLGQDHVVYIDRGADQNVTPGDIYTIYRLSEVGMPPMVLGELAVLSVQKRSALAKITESRYAIFVGDRLDPK